MAELLGEVTVLAVDSERTGFGAAVHAAAQSTTQRAMLNAFAPSTARPV